MRVVMSASSIESTLRAVSAAGGLVVNGELVIVSVLGLISGLLLGSGTIGEDQVRT
jgi:hypothetical protein